MEKEITPNELAIWMHNNYEELSIKNGWSTQKITRVPFDKLPVSNKTVMISLAKMLINKFKNPINMKNEKLMTEQQFIAKFEKQGFVLIKEKPNAKKLNLLFKIQKLIKDV